MGSFWEKGLPINIDRVQKGVRVGMKNPAPSRIKSGGGFYTPPTICLKCEEGSIYIVEEDVVSSSVDLRGIVLHMTDHTVVLQEDLL